MRKYGYVILGLLASAFAAGEASASDKNVLFIDHGMLTSVSDSGVLKIDTVTGDMYLAKAGESSGRELFFVAPQKLKTPIALDRFVFLESGSSGMEKAVGDCSFKQETLSAATQLVTLACGPGGSSSLCSLARGAALEAWHDFWLCADNIPEP